MSLVIVTLQGATQSNTVAFYAPNRTTFIKSSPTGANGQFSIQLEKAQYTVKVNDSCWATSPDPLLIYLPLQFVTIVAPCTQ